MRSFIIISKMNCQICGKYKASRRYNVLAVCGYCLRKKELEEERALIKSDEVEDEDFLNDDREDYHAEKIFSWMDIPPYKNHY
jgi:hypothetical protein